MNHEMTNLLFSEQSRRNDTRMSSATNLPDALMVKPFLMNVNNCSDSIISGEVGGGGEGGGGVTSYIWHSTDVRAE